VRGDGAQLRIAEIALKVADPFLAVPIWNTRSAPLAR
jgi:hypothetical protein